MWDYNSFLSPELDLTKEQSIIEIRTWSNSDFKRITDFLENLNTNRINHIISNEPAIRTWEEIINSYLLAVYSAHRTPQSMINSAKLFPEINIPEWISKQIQVIKSKIKLCVAIAGGSAHIAWMTASETSTPIIALPVESTAWGIIDSTFSMINMPPWIPNGFVPNQKVAANIVKKLYNLELPENFTNIQISESLNIDKKLLNELGLTIWESPIWIDIQNIESDWYFTSENYISIIIPTIKEQLNWNNLAKMKNIKEEWLYMWLTIENDIRSWNALIYAAKIIWIFNPEVRKKVEIYSNNLTNEVLWINADLFEQQAE